MHNTQDVQGGKYTTSAGDSRAEVRKECYKNIRQKCFVFELWASKNIDGIPDPKELRLYENSWKTNYER